MSAPDNFIDAPEMYRATPITAPTTRETADHAELARLAEAAKTVRRDANGRLDGDDAVRMWVAFHDAMSPSVCSALLSEIAALRGALEEAEKDASSWSRCAGEVVTIGESWKERFVQAERQRDELRKALEDHDQTAAECRIDGARPQRDTTAPCELCGATQRESCGRKGSAAYAFISSARTLLANQGADQ